METALTLPLTVFLVLGTLQLFLLLQGRVMAEHAAFKAVRAGVVHHGDCRAMTHAAIAALLPSFSSFLGASTPGATPSQKLARAFRDRTAGKPNQNAYEPSRDGGHDRAVVWIFRQSPLAGQVRPTSEDDFDALGTAANPTGYRLAVRLVYWFPLKIPFANWVLATMFRARFGLGDHVGYADPLMPVASTRWVREGTATLGPLGAEFLIRFNARQFVFPVTASYAMRMMTPPRPALFARQNCAPAP